jgi:hypothetical protein
MAIASGTGLKDLPEGQRAGSDSAENTGQFFFRIHSNIDADM